MKIDPTKKYQARDGREVTFLHRVPDGMPTRYPWRGIAGADEVEWTDAGEHSIGYSNHPLDLVEVREPREWIVRVATEGNRANPPGEIIGTQGARAITLANDSKWVEVRVREVIEEGGQG